MKLSEYKEEYQELSGLASNVSRQLAFAGIALIWIFKTQNTSGAGYQLPRELLFPAAALIISLALDLLQYFISSLIWGAFHRYHEKRKTKKDPDLDAPPCFNWPSLVCFYLKIIAVLIAYLYLLDFANRALFLEPSFMGFDTAATLALP